MAAAESAAVGLPGAESDDRRARLRLVADRVAPLALARERILPVLAPLEGLFPDGSLRRGSIVAVDGIGATSLALAVAAGPSAAGSWIAVVGDPALGLAAAAEAGVALERILVIDPPEPQAAAAAVAALVGAVDVVLVGSRLRLRPADIRRLSARLRERGSVLIRLGSADTPGVDVGLHIVESRWSGLGSGHGLLRSRHVSVATSGRGASAQPRTAELLLPGPQGAPVLVGAVPS